MKLSCNPPYVKPSDARHADSSQNLGKTKIQVTGVFWAKFDNIFSLFFCFLFSLFYDFFKHCKTWYSKEQIK